jgi:hypothetical protein
VHKLQTLLVDSLEKERLAQNIIRKQAKSVKNKIKLFKVKDAEIARLKK